MSTAVAVARTVREVLQEARRALSEATFEPSTREAALLLGHVLGLDEASILSRSAEPLDARAERAFGTLLHRRLAGEPVAYLIGWKEFYGRKFEVDDRVLIPRPETEHLIEMALQLPLGPGSRVTDLGTGSGSIALTLALERPDWTVFGCDASVEALAVAARNRARWDLGRHVRLAAADLSTALRLDDVDLVVSNPPYIAPEDSGELSVEITSFEPAKALFAADAGKALVKRLFVECGSMRPGGRLLIEIGAGQLDDLRAAASTSPFRIERCTEDYAGKPRVLQLVRRQDA